MDTNDYIKESHNQIFNDRYYYYIKYIKLY